MNYELWTLCVMSMSGVIFEDVYVCVILIYKDKLQNNYSINELLINF